MCRQQHQHRVHFTGANVTAVAAGHDHTCAVMSGGGLLCWGDNSNGQLGIGSMGQQDSPVAVVLGAGDLFLVERAHACAPGPPCVNLRCCASATARVPSVQCGQAAGISVYAARQPLRVLLAEGCTEES